MSRTLAGHRRIGAVIAVAAFMLPTSAASAQSAAPPCETGDKTIKIVSARPSGDAAVIVVEVSIVGRITFESSTGGQPGGEFGYDVNPGRSTIKVPIFYPDRRPLRNETVKVTLRLTPGREGGDPCTQPDGTRTHTNELPPGPPATVSVPFYTFDGQAVATPTGEAADIDAILEAGGYLVEVTTAGTCTFRIVWYHTRRGRKPVVVGAGSKTVKRGSRVVRVKLTPEGRALLRDASRLKVLAKGTVTCAGYKQTAKAQRTFTLKD